jgi:putative addiction module killer protein
VYAIQKTDAFAKWLKGLRDLQAKARILSRLDSARLGNLGDCKSVGAGVWEMRVHSGPGYRLYYVLRNDQIVLLLCGGTKTSQRSDIARAKRIAAEVEDH